MKLVYSHPNFAQVGLVRSLLTNGGIPSVVRNEHLSPLAGSVPALDVWPQLYVADEDVLLAQSIIKEHENTQSVPQENWICPRCGAENEGNMAICWNCDYEIDAPTQT